MSTRRKPRSESGAAGRENPYNDLTPFYDLEDVLKQFNAATPHEEPVANLARFMPRGTIPGAFQRSLRKRWVIAKSPWDEAISSPDAADWIMRARYDLNNFRKNQRKQRRDRKSRPVFTLRRGKTDWIVHRFVAQVKIRNLGVFPSKYRCTTEHVPPIFPGRVPSLHRLQKAFISNGECPRLVNADPLGWWSSYYKATGKYRAFVKPPSHSAKGLKREVLFFLRDASGDTT